jgi:hypothetical protein
MEGAAAPKLPPALLQDDAFSDERDDVGRITNPPYVIFTDQGALLSDREMPGLPLMLHLHPLKV